MSSSETWSWQVRLGTSCLFGRLVPFVRALRPKKRSRATQYAIAFFFGSHDNARVPLDRKGSLMPTAFPLKDDQENNLRNIISLSQEPKLECGEKAVKSYIPAEVR